MFANSVGSFVAVATMDLPARVGRRVSQHGPLRVKSGRHGVQSHWSALCQKRTLRLTQFLTPVAQPR